VWKVVDSEERIFSKVVDTEYIRFVMERIQLPRITWSGSTQLDAKWIT